MKRKNFLKLIGIAPLGFMLPKGKVKGGIVPKGQGKKLILQKNVVCDNIKVYEGIPRRLISNITTNRTMEFIGSDNKVMCTAEIKKITDKGIIFHKLKYPKENTWTGQCLKKN